MSICLRILEQSWPNSYTPMSFINHIPFGLIGLGLAVLDFTGASKKLEAVLARYIEHEKRDAAEAREHLFTTDISHHWPRFKASVPGALVLAVVFTGLWLWAGDQDKALWIIDWLPRWPWWSVIFWGPVALLAFYVFDHVTDWGFIYVVSILIWRILWLLSIPKAGIVGTLGLLIALADNLIRT